MKRSELPLPYTTALIDLNSEAAYTVHGEVARKAPRLLPVPYQTISEDPAKLLLEPWRKNLTMYPQLYFIIGRDIPVNDGNITAADILGIGLGLAYSDDGILVASPDPTPRDTHMCYWYSLYSDNSQVLSDELTAGVNTRDLTITIESETLGKAQFCQKDLLFDPVETLQEMNCLVAYTKNDLISLGSAGTSIQVPADKKFQTGEVIRITCEGLGAMEITVDDQRDGNVNIPSWTPREYYMNTVDTEN